MVKQTLNYEAPSVEVIRLTFRDSEVLCASPNGPINTEGLDGDDDETPGN